MVSTQQIKPAEKFEITFATANDLPHLVELLVELFSMESDFTPNWEKQLQGLRLILNNPAYGRLFVLRVEGKPVGMANALLTVSTSEGGFVEILEDLIVNKAYRGKGFGQYLVEHVLAWARQNRLARVTLLVDQDNRPAQTFYHKLGLEPSGIKVLRKKLI
jgi:GNAT superfamily N-acetyltransferase